MTLDKSSNARAKQILHDLIACVNGVRGGDECSNGRHDGKLGYHIKNNSIIIAPDGTESLEGNSQDTDGIKVRVLNGRLWTLLGWCKWPELVVIGGDVWQLSMDDHLNTMKQGKCSNSLDSRWYCFNFIHLMQHYKQFVVIQYLRLETIFLYFETHFILENDNNSIWFIWFSAKCKNEEDNLNLQIMKHFHATQIHKLCMAYTNLCYTWISLSLYSIPVKIFVRVFTLRKNGSKKSIPCNITVLLHSWQSIPFFPILSSSSINIPKKKMEDYCFHKIQSFIRHADEIVAVTAAEQDEI